MKKQRIRATAIINKVHRAGMFTAHLQDNPDHCVLLSIAGRMQCGEIKIVIGDIVDVELTPYDLTRGRIIWRHHDPERRR